MSTNEGMIDRALRVIVGLALVGVALGMVPGVPAYTWAWIGVVPIFTGLIGWCPAYTILGVNTCAKKS